MPSQTIYVMDSEPYYIGWLSDRLDITKVKKITWDGTIDSVVLGIKVHSPDYWMVTQLAMNDQFILHDEIPKIVDGNGCQTKAETYSSTLGGLTSQPISVPLKTIIKQGDNKFFIRIKNTNSWLRGQDYTITMWLDVTYSGEIHFEPTTGAPGAATAPFDISSLMDMMIYIMFMMMFMSLMMGMVSSVVPRR